MNEDKLIGLISNFDDDLIENEIDNLLEGVEINMDAINEKAHQKLDKHNKKAKFRRRLPYVAAVCACFLFINTVYADEISGAVKSFFNKTPVYSTMVDGSAYYLKTAVKLDDNFTVDSAMVSNGKLDMSLTSTMELKDADLHAMKLVPKNDPNTTYEMGGYSIDGDNKYSFSFMNGTENNYNIKPFPAFDLTIAGKTFTVNLDEAKSMDMNKKIYTSDASANLINGVDFGAKTFDENGKVNVQLIAAFKDDNMEISRFGQPIDKTVKMTVENKGDSILSGSSGGRTEDIYVYDDANNKYKLETPADAKAFPVTTFETNAPKDSNLTLKVPALLADDSKFSKKFALTIPKDGETTLNQEIDLPAQKAVIKSIKRVSPTSAVVEFDLNTGADKNTSIRSFMMYCKDVKKISAEFSGDKAVATLEFNKDISVANIEITFPEFMMNGNWTIKLK